MPHVSITNPTYHIIWTTYGAWLPGDTRGWIRRGEPGTKPPDAHRERRARERMADSAVVLTPAQRLIVEQTVRDHCHIRDWTLHAVQVLSNHVHVVVAADHDGWDMMKQFKAWCSRKLSDAASLEARVADRAGRRRWFTEGGDVQFIRDEAYFRNALEYVLHGQ